MSGPWMASFPEGWRRLRLKNLVAEVRNGTWGEEPTEDEGTVCVRSADFDRQRLRISTEKLVRRALTARELRLHRLELGDLILEKSGGGEEQPVGLAVLYDLQFEAVATNFAARVRAAYEVEPRYLCYALAAIYYAGINERSIKQTTGIQNLDSSSFFNEPWAIPQLREQRAIADLLGRETARIDELILKKQHLRDRIDERFYRQIAHAVDGCAEFSLSRIGLPAINSRFDVVRLGSLARVQTGLTLDAARATTGDAVTLPYLRVANVQDGWLDLDEVKEVTVPAPLARRCLLMRGDVLMTEGGDPDKLGRGMLWDGQISRCLHQNHVFAVRTDKSRLLPEFLALLTRTPYARAYFEMTASKTTGIASTSTRKIAGWGIPVPSTNEQGAIIAKVADVEGHARKLQVALGRQIALLVEHRQALITAGVTGQLEVEAA